MAADTNPLEELLVDELKDLYSAENQIVKALPKMAKAASAPELKRAFERHLEETRRQIERLNQIDGSMPRLDAIPPGCAFNPRCKEAGPRCRRERPNLISAGAGASACWLNAGGIA